MLTSQAQQLIGKRVILPDGRAGHVDTVTLYGFDAFARVMIVGGGEADVSAADLTPDPDGASDQHPPDARDCPWCEAKGCDRCRRLGWVLECYWCGCPLLHDGRRWVCTSSSPHSF